MYMYTFDFPFKVTRRQNSRCHYGVVEMIKKARRRSSKVNDDDDENVQMFYYYLSGNLRLFFGKFKLSCYDPP